jgi:hypothetical protein
MYIMMAFMGMDLAGARATSQAFFSLRRSVSSWVGGLREGVEVGPSFWETRIRGSGGDEGELGIEKDRGRAGEGRQGMNRDYLCFGGGGETWRVWDAYGVFWL